MSERLHILRGEFLPRRARWLTIGLLWIVGVLGCTNDETPRAACEPGTAGCECLGATTCLDHEGEAMQCLAGRCSPQTCPAGTLGCGCFGNQTCGRLGAVPMTCENDRCRETVVPEPGTLGGACGDGIVCASRPGEPPLVCEAGRCARSDCTFGAPGCPCGTLGRCDGTDGRAMRCMDGVCLFDDCRPGEETCPCDGTQCAAGMACVAGICHVDPTRQLFVENPAARACDVTLEDPEGDLDVRFDGPATGRSARRDRFVYLALHAREDAPLRAAVASMRPTTPRSRDASRIRVVDAECFDRTGQPLPGASVGVR
jgi:hypothetical protein